MQVTMLASVNAFIPAQTSYPISSAIKKMEYFIAMDNGMERLKGVVFYENKIYQQVINPYLERVLDNCPLSLEVISRVDVLLEKIADSNVDVLTTEFNYLYSHKDWNSNINTRFCKLCSENHVRRLLFISGTNIWLLPWIIDMKFEAIVSANDNINELHQEMSSIIGSERQVPYLSERIKAILHKAHKGPQMLSSTEWDVLYLLAQGFSISQIATRKNQAVSTVATQKHNAMKKINISTNCKLLKFIQPAGIME
ncbi:TPA: response regulator transcription factor [Enterobacter kobei]|nr:response regulator transcription factor [Enterobacter kobei]